MNPNKTTAEAPKGLVLRKAGELTADLHVYELERWEGGVLHSCGTKLAASAETALWQFFPDPRAVGFSWITGPVVTQRLARKFRLRHRKRLPGAGRKRTSNLVGVTIWMHPDGAEELARRAAEAKLGQGRYIEEKCFGISFDAK